MADGAIETGIYLITPTHVGSGQASGAIDLPIVREGHTGYPVLPSTAVKGVLRRQAPDSSRENWFGPEPPKKGDADKKLVPGQLVFTDGHLLAFPVRALHTAFVWITCPLVVERWHRMRSVLRLDVPPLAISKNVATFDVKGPIVVEDVSLDPAEVRSSDGFLKEVASRWARLMPSDQGRLRSRFEANLLCVDDTTFADLVRRATPVNARVQLSENKTTTDGGNLWYEETLPPDCLFSAMVTHRNGNASAVEAFARHMTSVSRVQIGGNETVGQGMAWWTAEVNNG